MIRFAFVAALCVAHTSVAEHVDTPVLQINTGDAVDLEVNEKIAGSDVPGVIQGLKWVSLTMTTTTVPGWVCKSGGTVSFDPWLIMCADIPDNWPDTPRETTCIHGACAQTFTDPGPFVAEWDDCPASSHVLIGGSWTDNLRNPWIFTGTFGIDMITSIQCGGVSVGAVTVAASYTMNVRWFPDDQDSNGTVNGADLARYVTDFATGAHEQADEPEPMAEIVSSIIDAIRMEHTP